MEVSAEAFEAFLQEARANTWASGQPAAVGPAGEHRYEYAASGLQYRDAYMVTETSFFGQETVLREGQAMWNMIYAGQVHKGAAKDPGPAAVYALLRRAVLAAGLDSRIGRAADYTEGEWTFADQGETHGNEFWGEEWITLRGAEVYRLKYGGGWLPQEVQETSGVRR